MSKEKRYLITTADEQTWKSDRPVIFLGEWCRLYARKHIWQSMDAIVAAPYGLGLAKKDADYAEAVALEDQLLPLMCNALNKYHRTNHGTRFWRIVLGHWLRRYVNVMLNRVKTLEQCLQMHKLSGVTVYSNDNYTLATFDSYSAIWAFNDEYWNNALNVRILDLLGTTSCQVEVIEGCTLQNFHFNTLAATPTLKRQTLNWGLQKGSKLTDCFARDNDVFITNSYLPKKDEIKLQLALRQFPQLWSSPKLEVLVKPDNPLRERLANKFANSKGHNLQHILYKMAFELLPICYLEGYAALSDLVKQQPFPKEPKLIFTSNNYDTDEVFKLWAATKVESGCKYIIGQHGNNYGTHRHMHPTIEETTADKFITWGWTDGLPQHTPAFIFKTAARKADNFNPQGGLLLIELPLPDRITTWDGYLEFEYYFKEQQKFVRYLENVYRQHLTIRLHSMSRYMSWSEEARWREFDPSLKIDTGSTSIRELILKSRLVVHSYDSTGILETLSQNIPTLAFWQNGFDHLRESAKPYYQLLVDAGIVHFTPESVVQKVKAVWDDVDAWWLHDDIQDVRNKFCERYARVSKSPVSELKTIIKI